MKEFRKITELRHWDQNPRTIDKKAFESLLKKIRRWGQFKPVLVTEDGEVIGGNMRLEAYKTIGINDVWVSVVNPKTEAEKIEIALADNEMAGRWDEDKLAEIITPFKSEIVLEDYQLDLGNPSNLKEIISKYGPDGKEDDFDPTEALQGETESKYGEVYQLGEHRLMCGDATIPADVDKLMDGKKAYMVFTDPPYNMAYEGQGGVKREGILNDKMSSDKFYNFLLDALSNQMRVCDGVWYVCMGPAELPNLKVAFETAGGHYQSFIIWVKDHFNISGADWQNQYEPILYGWNGKTVNHYYAGFRDEGNVWERLDGFQVKRDNGKSKIRIAGYNIEIEGEPEVQVTRAKKQIDVWYVDKPKHSDEHPTMKPISLCVKAIKANSKIGDIVLDTFGGSGSTLIACEQTNRVCYTMELDPKYCDVIRKRYAKLQGKEDEWQAITPKI